MKKTLYLLVLICNLAIAQEGNDLFDDTYIHVIEINSIVSQDYDSFHTILKDDWYEYFDTHFGPDGRFRRNYFEASVSIDGTLLDTVGVRYKGQSSMLNADWTGKHPIKLDFNEYIDGLDYDGIKKINLNSNIKDPSIMRSKLSFEILDRMGIISPRVAFAKVYINGSYRGLYTMVEQIDKTFVRNHISPDSTGYLYKNYAWIGNNANDNSNPEYHRQWNPLKTKKSTDNYQPLIGLGVTAQAASDSEFENDINGIFDMESFIKQQATNMAISDRDHYCGANWNFYMYLNPYDNKWYMLPWDYDLAFNATDVEIVDPANWASLSNDNRFLTKRMLEIPNLRQDYYEALCESINVGMDSVWLNNRIVEISDLISSEVENDPFFYEMDNYETYLDQTYVKDLGQGFSVEMPGLRSFINDRYATVRSSLLAQGFTCEIQTTSNTNIKLQNDYLVYPNPTNNRLNIDWKDPYSDISSISIVNILGQVLLTYSDAESLSLNNTELDLSELRNGTYFLHIKINDFSESIIHKITKVD